MNDDVQSEWESVPLKRQETWRSVKRKHEQKIVKDVWVKGRLPGMYVLTRFMNVRSNGF